MERLFREPWPDPIVITFVVFFAIVTTITTLPAFGTRTPEVVISPSDRILHLGIFDWVIARFNEAHSMTICQALSMPKIEYVSRERFIEIWYEESQEDYLERWVPKLGRKRADWIREFYANSAAGLYLPKSVRNPEEIYILATLSLCEKGAFLVHELTHYLQDILYGEIDLDSPNADRQNALHEMKARRSENMYRYEFCH